MGAAVGDQRVEPLALALRVGVVVSLALDALERVAQLGELAMGLDDLDAVELLPLLLEPVVRRAGLARVDVAGQQAVCGAHHLALLALQDEIVLADFAVLGVVVGEAVGDLLVLGDGQALIVDQEEVLLARAAQLLRLVLVAVNNPGRVGLAAGLELREEEPGEALLAAVGVLLRGLAVGDLVLPLPALTVDVDEEVVALALQALEVALDQARPGLVAAAVGDDAVREALALLDLEFLREEVLLAAVALDDLVLQQLGVDRVAVHLLGELEAEIVLVLDRNFLGAGLALVAHEAGGVFEAVVDVPALANVVLQKETVLAFDAQLLVLLVVLHAVLDRGLLAGVVDDHEPGRAEDAKVEAVRPAAIFQLAVAFEA